MTSKTATILGCVGAFITFLLTAQATGAAGVDLIPPFVWLLIGGFGATINFATGKMNPGSNQAEDILRALADMTPAQRQKVFNSLEPKPEAPPSGGAQ